MWRTRSFLALLSFHLGNLLSFGGRRLGLSFLGLCDRLMNQSSNEIGSSLSVDHHLEAFEVGQSSAGFFHSMLLCCWSGFPFLIESIFFNSSIEGASASTALQRNEKLGQSEPLDWV